MVLVYDHSPLKNHVFSVVMGWDILQTLITSCWLMVLLSSFISLLVFCLGFYQLLREVYKSLQLYL